MRSSFYSRRKMICSGLPPLTLNSIAAAKAKTPKYRKELTPQTPIIKAKASKSPKKSRKLPTTPRSRVRSALRTVWLRSRERAACLKLAGNCCAKCGVKASKAKGREIGVQVHHVQGIANWEAIIDLVFAEILVDPSLLSAICEPCHKAEHGK